MPNAPRACSRTRGRPGPGFKVEDFPDHSIVVCVGSCIKNDVGIVYAEHAKARWLIETGGDGILAAAARTDDAPAGRGQCRHGQSPSNVWRAALDSAHRPYRSPAAADMQCKIQAAAAAAVARTDGKLQDATPAPDDWGNGHTSSPSLKPRTRHRAAERRGGGQTALNAAAPHSRDERNDVDRAAGKSWLGSFRQVEVVGSSRWFAFWFGLVDSAKSRASRVRRTECCWA